jgi:hypothetical protein
MIKFDDTTIQKIFGNEAAENETTSRLLQYYLKPRIFDRITADLPIRILVAPKGTGKSALLKVAFQEDIENRRLPIWLRPDDISGIATENKNFNQLVAEWKTGLNERIVSAVLKSFGNKTEGVSANLANFGGKALAFLRSFFKTTKIKYGKEDSGQIETEVAFEEHIIEGYPSPF